jgi:hypothetical protein
MSEKNVAPYNYIITICAVVHDGRYFLLPKENTYRYIKSIAIYLDKRNGKLPQAI